MRTKTLALTALLGMLGSASVMAQNVYSINAVGYINSSIIANGWTLLSCPLICSPDNTLGTILLNGGGGLASSNQYNGLQIYQWDTALTPAAYLQDTANAKLANRSGYTNGWESGGTIALNPGSGMWIYNPGSAVTATFVGTVPVNGSPYLTNVLAVGFNMVSSAIPISGDLYTSTNTLMKGFPHNNDSVYLWDTSLSPPNYDPTFTYTTHHSWTGSGSAGDPVTASVSQAFWYQNEGSGAETWVENFAVAP